MYLVDIEMKKNGSIPKTKDCLNKNQLFKEVVFPFLKKESIILSSTIKYDDIEDIQIFETNIDYQKRIENAYKKEQDGLFSCYTFKDVLSSDEYRNVTEEIFGEAKKLL